MRGSRPLTTVGVTPAVPGIRPALTAGLLAGSYVAVACAYIWLSGSLAARLARDLNELAALERIKGILFVVVTGAALFAVTFAFLARLAQRSREASRANTALLHAERMAFGSSLAGSVAHDIRNALTAARVELDLYRADAALTPVEAQGFDNAQKALARVEELAARLMESGQRVLTEEAVTFDPRAALADALAQVEDHPLSDTRTLLVDGPDDLPPALGHPGLVTRALVNLMLNGAEATLAGGRVRITWDASGDTLTFQVDDDGPGIPPDERSRIFDAFYSSKDRGSGLGLLSVKACALQHGGSVEVDASDLGGACFRLRLPVLREYAAPVATARRATA